MGTFDLDLDELVKKAEEEKGLNKVIKNIIKECNYQFTDDPLDKYNRNYSILASQVVGGEYR